MKQQIILAPNLSGTDYLKSLAMFNKEGTNTFGVRVMNSLELARYMLQTSGVVVDKEFISNNNLSAMLYKTTKDIPYFKDYTLLDIYNLLLSVNNLRKCIPSDEEEAIKKLPMDQFRDKNDAVKEFYKRLINTLSSNNLIDEISIIRLAIEKAQPLKNVNFSRYDEFELTELDKALLEKAAGEVVDSISVDDNSKLNISTYLKSYGQNNEIEWILNHIYENHIKFDECLIVATDVTGYAKILSNYQAAIGFPLIIGNSQSIFDTAPGRLLSSLLEWEKNHFHLDYLVKLLNSREFNLQKFKTNANIPDNFDYFTDNEKLEYFDRLSFDKIVEYVGNLGIGFSNKTSNDQRFNDLKELVDNKCLVDSKEPKNKRDQEILKFVANIKQIFEQGLEKILEEYVVIDDVNDVIDSNALKSILLVLSYRTIFGVKNEDALKFLDSVAVGNRRPKPGHLYITSINSAISYLRKHVFIVGLDSKVFPGGVAEDPTIFDRDYAVYGLDNASSKKMEDNKKAYHALVSFAKTLGCNIHLSYAFYNSQTLKEQSASSVVFETYSKEHVGEMVTVVSFNDEFDPEKGRHLDKFLTISFFDKKNLFPLSRVGSEIKNNVILKPTPTSVIVHNPVDASCLFSKKSKGLSASNVKYFVECEYEFFLRAILHVDQEEETDIYEIIPSNDLGTILHATMEHFNNKMSKNDFLEIGKKLFKEYMIYHPTDNKPGEERELAEFLEILDNAHSMETLNGVLCEEDIVATHTLSGLKIHGKPDKIEHLSGDKYRVVDYKTGRNISHKPDDPKTMLQGAQYAYLLEHGKHKLNENGKACCVSEIVFRYPRMKESVSSAALNSEGKPHEMKEYMDELDSTLVKIANAIKSSKFEKTGKCNKCYLKSVCGGKK